MKRTAFLNLVIVAVALSFTVVGCKRSPKSLTPIPGSTSGNRPVTGGPGMGPGEGAGGTGVGSEGLQASEVDRDFLANSTPDPTYFAAQTVYFDFDSSSVSPSEISKVQVVADYLRSETVGVMIEGHCDARGTEEYNRALGERRAQSIREILVTQMGANADRVFTVSYGEDMPAVNGTTAADYAKNRRGVFVLLVPNK